ncbi:hypothetical protein [Asanoa iriomotensis]|uniref:hypothetical protein n=1 Tax=Asanoa iriomotensis TaxID=234613 RepID=UPI0019420CCF|nr:hypothetical protein [Asanoa iriomotensis]
MAVAVLAAGCGGGEPATGGEWVAAPPASTAPARLAKVTSACKLLSAATVMKVLGPTSKSTLKARELPVDKSDGEVAYSCAYGKDGQEPFALTVSTRPDQSAKAESTIETIAAASGVETTPVDDLGTAGVGYVKDAFRVVAVTVPYETDLRLVIFAAPQIVPQAKLVEVLGQVVTKI